MKVHIIVCCCLIFLNGCFDPPEPKFWERADYEPKGKPDNREYLFCGRYSNEIIELKKDQEIAVLYEYDDNIEYVYNIAQWNKLPEPDFVENQIVMKKYKYGDEDTKTYTTSIPVWEGRIQGCALPKELEMSYKLEPLLDSEKKAFISFSKSFGKVYIDFKERRNTNCSAPVVQSIAESQAVGYYESSATCKFMPDEFSFEQEKMILREYYKKKAIEYKKEKFEELSIESDKKQKDKKELESISNKL